MIRVIFALFQIAVCQVNAELSHRIWLLRLDSSRLLMLLTQDSLGVGTLLFSYVPWACGFEFGKEDRGWVLA